MLVMTPSRLASAATFLAVAVQWTVVQTVDDLTGLTGLLPLGGAALLLIYLLRLISYERQRWITEREALVEEFRREMADKDADIVRREADHEHHSDQWRRRYDELHQDFMRVYGELRQAREDRHD